MCRASPHDAAELELVPGTRPSPLGPELSWRGAIGPGPENGARSSHPRRALGDWRMRSVRLLEPERSLVIVEPFAFSDYAQSDDEAGDRELETIEVFGAIGRALD